jgi:hypothetical protein
MPKLEKSKTFAKSDIDNILISKEAGFVYFLKTEEKYKPMYDQFNQDFSLYLSKLPNHAAKKYVSEIFGRNLIYLGLNQLAKTEGFFSRAVVNDEDGLKGIVLDIKDLDIKMNTGETKNIDDCIYASYFSFLKAVTVANKMVIRNDEKLHEMLAQYLYLLVISSMDSKSTINTPKQKFFVKIICYYAFYRYFIKERHPLTIKILRNIFDDGKDLFEEFEPRFKDIEKYDSVKDIPKMLIDSKVLIIDPNTFIINLVKKYRQYGFFCILGSLDMFIAFIITCKYPFELFSDAGALNSDLQNKIEDHMVYYMKKIKFGTPI